MQSLKSPGPDGLPPLFYKKYWKVVGHSVIKAVHNFFISGKMLKEVNYSYIVFIPKGPKCKETPWGFGQLQTDPLWFQFHIITT